MSLTIATCGLLLRAHRKTLRWPHWLGANIGNGDFLPTWRQLPILAFSFSARSPFCLFVGILASLFRFSTVIMSSGSATASSSSDAADDRRFSSSSQSSSQSSVTGVSDVITASVGNKRSRSNEFCINDFFRTVGGKWTCSVLV